MFYIQLQDRRWNKPKSPDNKAAATCKLSEVEATNEKSSNFALIKTTEYIRNIQQVYNLEFPLFC
ncbi:Transposase [Nostoc sp. DSM 114161]